MPPTVIVFEVRTEFTGTPVWAVKLKAFGAVSFAPVVLRKSPE